MWSLLLKKFQSVTAARGGILVSWKFNCRRQPWSWQIFCSSPSQRKAERCLQRANDPFQQIKRAKTLLKHTISEAAMLAAILARGRGWGRGGGWLICVFPVCVQYWGHFQCKVCFSSFLCLERCSCYSKQAAIRGRKWISCLITPVLGHIQFV